LKRVLFLTGHVPASRSGAYAALGERVPLDLVLYGGRHQHGAPPGPAPANVLARAVRQRDVGRVIAGGEYAAVIAGTGGRVALPLAWRAARAQRLPFIFWAALWHTPRTPAHLAAAPLMARIYREAAALVTYGPHVSAYLEDRTERPIFVAPQAVDNEFWSAPVAVARDERFRAVFVGRDEHAKGLAVLLEAWQRSGLAAEGGVLTLVGTAARELPGVEATGRLDALALRNLYARSHVLVVPSIPTRRFVEPWGLVVNEAMNRECAILATGAVGAAAGGLVCDARNGLVVPAGEPAALASALRALASDPARCRALGRQGREDVASYTYAAWAGAFEAAIELVCDGANAGSVGP
jgi:glycosyltransferase involved in cell wall biosynthesis